jgi:hypothetical protein
MIYRIPIVGFVRAAYETYVSQQLCFRCRGVNECFLASNVNQVALGHFNESTCWTVGFLILVKVALFIYRETR